MKNKLSKIALCSVLAASITSTAVLAESMAAQIKKRATEMAELKALLNDPDQSMRLAALDTMLKSEDTAMRELAYNVGLNSADDAVRSITLRNKFNEISSFSINVALPKGADKQSVEFFSKYAGGGIYSIYIEKYDEKKGNFTFNDQGKNSDRKGSVSGLTLSFRGYYCNGNLILNEESEYQGNLNCRGVSYPVTALVM
jgi:hypothetical protein